MLTAGLLFAKPAQADPHGVFFTVVGQQQLFFNILAALNQADYVEPLQLRQQLAQGRDTAGYVPSSDARLTSTATQLAEVLTRSVSLEGQDVRTQERSDEFAREVVRQQRVAELIKQYCQEAFGAPDCTGDVEEGLKKAPGRRTGREQSFIQDPLAYARLPHILGIMGALTSGTKEHDDFAKEILLEAQAGGIALPFEYSPEIAAWRKAAEDSRDGQRAVAALDRALANTADTFLQGDLNPGFWKDVHLTSDGGAEVDIGPSDDSGRRMTPANGVAKHYRSFTTLVAMPRTFDEIAHQAEQRVNLQLNSTIVDGAVPDREHYPEGGLGTAESGRISTIVTTPANVKVGLQQQLLLLLAQLEGNPDFVDPSQIDNPAGESAVDRKDKGPLKIGTPLEALQSADVIEKGLLKNSGIVPELGLGRPFLRDFINDFLKAIVDKINREPKPN